MIHDSEKLWVLKFCVKLIFPKFNHQIFLLFIAIKYRIHVYRNTLNIMNEYTLKSVPSTVLKCLVKENLEDKLLIYLDKCLIISKEQFIQLSSLNLFYLDDGLLWVAVKASPNTKTRQKSNKDISQNVYNSVKKSFSYLSSEIHKQIFPEDVSQNINNVRILPIVGSEAIETNTAIVSEAESHNICWSLGLKESDDVHITLHPIPSLDYIPKIASIAEVNLMVNEFDLDNDFLKEILSNHFVTPKLVNVNDVFSVDLTPEVTSKYHYKYLDLVESSGKLFFKCKNLNWEKQISSNQQTYKLNKDNIIQPLFIVKGVTQLNLSENIHAIKPKDQFLKLSQCHQLYNSCPSGLRHKYDEIQDTITPFINGEIKELTKSLSQPIIPMLLLTGPLGSGRHLLVKVIAKRNGLNYLQKDCNSIQSSTAKQTEAKISSVIQKAKAAAPVIVLLDNFEVFAVDPENNEDSRLTEYFVNILNELYENYDKHTIIFIAVTDRTDLKPNIVRIFLEKIHIPKLNVNQRFQMLHWFASVMQLNIDEEDSTNRNKLTLKEDTTSLSNHTREVLQRVAGKTETFVHGDLDTLMHFALRESYLKQHNGQNQMLKDPDLRIVCEEDFNAALESIRSLQSEHLDAPKIPKVHWEDIGGLEKLKKELLKTIEFPIKYPHLFKSSALKRSGILLFGPPGCGKTLVAKAVSTELNVSFMSVKGPELLNMYIGQSEENVRRVFETARASSPCIIFLDELDALAPRRGAAGDSGGASDRVVSQLLAELDGTSVDQDQESSCFVFVMGATNRPDLLEQSLLRPGRLDKLIYVGPYCGQHEKTSVLNALCRGHNIHPSVSLSQISSLLPNRCTGAELSHVVTTARGAAVRRLVARLSQGEMKESALSQDLIVLENDDFQEGVDTYRPSITEEELAHYESMETRM